MMKTIKLYIVTLATLLLMPAATAWAQNVAQIGETPYATLEAAIAAVGDGQQIELKDNVTLSSDAVCTLTDGQSFQLDFNSHTVTKGNYSVQLAKGVMAETTATTDIFSTVEGAQIVYGVTHANAQHYAYYAATKETEQVAYIDTDGDPASVTAVVIDSRMDEMLTLEQDGWFVVNSDVALNYLTRIGTNNTNEICNFILADGKTLTLGNGSGDNFGGDQSRYTFYGQTNQTGKLVLGRPLNALSLTQNGGKIGFVNTVNAWISADVVISNGEMNLASSETGNPILGKSGSSSVINISGGVVKVYATGNNGIAMQAGDIIITGGQVEAIAEDTGGKGMKETSGSTITLGLTNNDDYIKATNYDGVVKIADGQTLYDSDAGNTPYTGTLDTDQKDAIKGHKLRASTSMSINDPSITVTVEPATYTGSAITPVVTVSGATAPLVAGTDYTVAFDGTYTNAKTYSNAITITGIGGYYTETRKADFVINPRSINDVTVTDNTLPYTGSAYSADEIKAPIKLNLITTAGSTTTTTTLQVGDDYTISVADGTYQDPGTYQGVITLAAVEGEGKNYVGSRTVDFIIQDAINIADCDIIATTVYNGQEQTPAATVVVKSGGTVVDPANYTITYDGTPNFTNVGTTQITVTGTGNSYFGSKVVDYVISPKDISGCTVNNSTAFTGAVIDPATVVTVTDGSTPLSSTTDYTLTVSQGYTYHDPQTYTGALTITGKGNYTGSVTKDFTISNQQGAINLATAAVVISKQTYTGADLKPTATTTTVTVNGTELIEGTDYTFSFIQEDDNFYKDAKIYSNAIIIKAKEGSESYYGTAVGNYIIEPRDLSDAGIIIKVDGLNYTSAEQAVTVKVNYGGTLNTNIDDILGGNNIDAANYTFTPTKVTEAGHYDITITAVENSNLVGSTTAVQWVFKSLDGNYATDFTVEPSPIPTQTYTGSEIKPTIVVKDKDRVMQLEDANSGDYSIEYTNNVDVGQATVTITGRYAYSGTITLNFYIVEEYFTVDDITYHHAKEGEEVSVGKKDGENNVLATTKTGKIEVPEKVTHSVGPEFTVTGIEKNALGGAGITAVVLPKSIADIADNAFKGADNVRYVDASSMKGYEPTTLTREFDGPFNGVPKQALVYLYGTTFTGENYVYKPGDGDTYYCEKFKIYDDLSGSQTGFTGDDYKWAYENIHPFMAYTIENTRMLTAGKHYTTCLPYTLAIPAGMKAYTLDATSDKLFGFSEVTGIISAFTPYVLIPSKSGQLLSTVTTTVPVFTEDAEGTESKLNPTQKGSFTLYGTMRYMDGTTAEGKYIMQYGGGSSTWLQVTGSYSYSNPCILPMRAYIAPSGSGARSYTATFTDVDGKQLTSDMLLDADDSMYYDLQGRKVDTPQRKGLYIKSSVEGKNGRKVINRR